MGGGLGGREGREVSAITEGEGRVWRTCEADECCLKCPAEWGAGDQCMGRVKLGVKVWVCEWE